MHEARPERGLKRVCLHCEAKFYDMMRFPILCPKCGTEYVEVVRPPPPPRQPRRSKFEMDRARRLDEAESRDHPASESDAAEPEEKDWDSAEEDGEDSAEDEEAEE